MPQTVQTSSEYSTHHEATLVRELSLMDSVMLMVGGIIGSGIFLTAGQIATAVHKPLYFLGVWIVGGFISLLACFGFAEMAAMYPEAGGQYVFLREAYGEFPAFLYGWMIFTVGQSGTIAALAVGFAEYFGAILPFAAAHKPIATILGCTLTRGHLVSIAAIVLLTTINVLGLKRGSALINVATWAKFAAIGIFVLLGLAIGKGSWSNYAVSLPLDQPASLSHVISGFGVALIAVFWAYDGWVYITWVAGEVKEPRHNVPRAMVLGVLVVGVIYMAMNVTYLYALPLGEIAQHETIAHAAAAALFSPHAAMWLSLMIAVSCFSAAATCTLSGARVYLAMAQDGVFFKRMAVIHPKWRTPAFSLIGQGIWAALLTVSGRYDQLYTYVIYGMVLSYTLTVIGMFLLRWKRPDIPRPYRCSGYPWLPAIYVLVGAAWTLNTIITRPTEAFWGTAIVLIGIPGYLYWKRSNRKAAAVE